ncbi:uncharacterized protein PGTG_10209 [Puccinia graminis f. sp. tritici CRL 75-36-700-3]|uniref:Uncharacterized protein n=1 Tax=Puccinia graminis f. sp. tritici (strain CRL 75-36-700-3 / race SCCL) TaxID=418459 RepID=E3KJL4_PUCGT|nr:uncharacterized protein PGTG_10209 [Puccinia graminis f. sp. tritici CRL 75-36-700-3]EFP84489.1 hypothetical protein PGTG_10209 [Puccinia graminis f. sp. tritici CRL 75-36-700-3]
MHLQALLSLLVKPSWVSCVIIGGSFAMNYYVSPAWLGDKISESEDLVEPSHLSFTEQNPAVRAPAAEPSFNSLKETKKDRNFVHLIGTASIPLKADNEESSGIRNVNKHSPISLNTPQTNPEILEISGPVPFDIESGVTEEAESGEKAHIDSSSMGMLPIPILDGIRNIWFKIFLALFGTRS